MPKNLKGLGAPSTLKAPASTSFTDTTTGNVFVNSGTFGQPNWKKQQFEGDAIAVTSNAGISGARLSGATNFSGGTFTAVTEVNGVSAFNLTVTGATFTGCCANASGYTLHHSLITPSSVLVATVNYNGSGNPFVLNASVHNGYAVIRISNNGGTMNSVFNIMILLSP